MPDLVAEALAGGSQATFMIHFWTFLLQSK